MTIITSINLRRLILILLTLFTGSTSIFCQVFPVRLNVNIAPPHSPYLADYFGAGSSKMLTTLSFNDINEASLNVRFRITLEGNGITLQTNPNMAFRPYIIVTGAQTIPSDILAEYFNTTNIAYIGTSASELHRTNNRLPEGGYNLCIEVIDHTSGKVVSNKACTYLFMQLSDEPVLLFPTCGSVIAQTDIQNIKFQWQPSNAVGSGSPLEYQFTLYEVTDRNTDPKFAIQNNKAQLIYTSDWQMGTDLFYSMSEPVLTQGKAYTYRVQARFADGKALKNNGYSEPCHLFFGYPTGGTIPLKQPLDNASFRDTDPLIFAWYKQSNLLAGQAVSYKVNVYKLNADQSKEEAVINNPVFYSQTYPASVPSSEYQTLLQSKLDKKSSYVWQVQSFTGTTLTAESQIRTFSGPALIESFQAGEYTVFIESTSNSDLGNLSGTGYFKVDSIGKTQKIQFSNLQINFVAGNFVLESGNVIGGLTDTTAIRLSPLESMNGYAYFHPTKYHIHRDGIKLYGHASWAFPHATEELAITAVNSAYTWLDYNRYKVSGTLNFANNNSFKLLEPSGFRFDLDPLSTFSIFLNRYGMTIHGNVAMPKLIKNTITTALEVKLPFSDASQLYYFKNLYRKPNDRILPVNNLGLHIAPLDYTFDFSEKKSPLKLQSDLSWKGVYLEKSDIVFLKEFDAHKQMSFDIEGRYNLVLLDNDTIYHHIDGDGLTFTFNRKFKDGYAVKVNTFPAYLSDFRIDIVKNTLNESHLNGQLFVPFVSTSQKFKFICPVTTTGIRPGYLYGLDHLEFVFNSNKDREKLLFKVSKAVFANQERIDMSFELKWPYLGMDLGNVNGFAIWGDYKIGFFSPNGTRLLEQQATGKYEDFEYTASKIGAGRNAGAYSIGIGGAISISSDIAGEKGAPEVNIYSISPNTMIPVEPETLQGDGQSMPILTGSSNGLESLSLTQRREIAGQELEKQFKSSVQTLASFDTPAEQVLSLPQIPTEQTIQIPLATLTDTSKAKNKEFIKGGLRAKLSDKEYHVVEQFVDEFIKLGYGIVGQKLAKTTGKITAKVDSVCNRGLNLANKYIDTKTHKLLDSLALKAVSAFKGKNSDPDAFDPTELVLKISDTIADEVAREIKRSIKTSLDKNLRNPIKDVVAVKVTDSINTFIVKFLQTSAHKLMNDELTGAQIVQNFKDEFPAQLQKSLNAVLSFVTPKNLAKTCEKTCVEALKGIDMGRVASRLTGGLISGSEKDLQKAWENMAEKQVNNLVYGAMQDVPVLNAIAGPTVQLNFNNLGEKLKKGDVGGIVSIDPTNISVNTKFVSFSGLLKNEKNDVYGNVWRANVLMQIKRPKPFSVEAVYLSGKKKGREYWFCQISPAADNAQKAGGKLSKEPKLFTTPATIGPIQLVAGTGRVYKHMKEIDKGTNIVPDTLTDFGAYLSLVAFDTQNKGKTLRIGLEAEFILSEDDNYVVDFEGNVQIMNTTVAYNKIDPKATIKGDVAIYYSSAESHLIVNGAVEVLKPGTLCAKGWIRYESKPNMFSIDVGNRDDKITFIMGCSGWGGLAFFHLDNQDIAVGIGIGYYVNARAAFDLGVVSGGIGVNAGLELMVDAKAQHTPDFMLKELGLWAHGFANIFVDYKTLAKSGQITLVSIDLVLEGRVRVNPNPVNVSGLAKGRACFLSWCIGFEAGFEKNV